MLLLLSAVLSFLVGCGGQHGINNDSSNNPQKLVGLETKVSVFGWADKKNEDSEEQAKMSAKQCLMLAQGAEITIGNDGLSLKKKNTHFIGLKYSTIKQLNDYAIIELTANLPIELPIDCKHLGKVGKSSPFNVFFISVAESAQTVLQEKTKNGMTIKSSFLILRKMELVAGKEPPECRYELDVYAKE